MKDRDVTADMVRRNQQIKFEINRYKVNINKEEFKKTPAQKERLKREKQNHKSYKNSTAYAGGRANLVGRIINSSPKWGSIKLII